MGQSLAIPRVIPEDWKRLDLIINKIRMRLGRDSSPTFAGVTITGLTHSTLIGANASKALESVTVGTGLDYTRPTLSLSHLGIEALTDPGADRIMFWDDSATACKWLAVGNSIAITATTIDTIQDIRTTATPTFAGLTVVNAITEFSTDGTMGGNSDSAVPTEKATKLYTDTLRSDLASNANAKGASLVGIEDSAAQFDATDVEAALAELIVLVTPVEYNPAMSRTAGGDAGGNDASVATIDDADSYDTDEISATPGFDIQAVFTGVTDFNQVQIHTAYDGNPAHVVRIDLDKTPFNWSSFDTILADIDDSSGDFVFNAITVASAAQYINSGEVRLRFYHSSAGNATHDFFIDYCALWKTGASVGITEHGGLTGLSDDDHLQYIKDSEFTQDSGILVGTGAGTFAEETGATVRTSLGLGTGDSPTFTNLTLTGDLDVGGDLDVVGHVALSGASVTALTGLYFFESKNITSAGDNSYRRGISVAYQVGKTGAADYTGAVAGLSTHVSIDDVNTQNWTHATALRGLSIDVDTESSSAGTITGACGIILVADFQDAVTVTNYYGIIHDTPTVVNNKLINAYGIYLGNFNTALTLNYAIYTNAGLVHFGDTVDLAVDLAIAHGGTGQSTAQTAINALSAVAGGTNEHVLTKDTGTGNAIWKVAAAGGFTSRCSVRRTANQSCASGGTGNKIEFNVVDYDNDSEFDTVTDYEFTVIANGYYHITAHGRMDLSANKQFVLSIFKNDAIIAQSFIINQALGLYFVTISRDLYLEIGDRIDINAYHNEGSARNLVGSAHDPYLTIHRFA